MPKATFWITLLGLGSFLMLQSFHSEAQITYGVKAGANFASLSYKANGVGETSKMIYGFEGGAFINLPVSGMFFIQPSLMYERKGGKMTTDIGGLFTNGNMRLDYLTLPVDLLINLKASGNSSAWLIGIGPYFGYGMYGNAMATHNGGSFSDNPFEYNADVGGASLKRFDAGANLQLDYKLSNGFSVGLNAELGMANIAANKAGDNPVHNTSFGVMVGYTFKRY